MIVFHKFSEKQQILKENVRYNGRKVERALTKSFVEIAACLK